jgi:hypothetical protein
MKEDKQSLSHPFTFHHKHIVHDLPLFRVLVVTWIVILVAGFMCGFFRKHPFVPMLKEAGHTLHLDDRIQIRNTFSHLFPLWL